MTPIRVILYSFIQLYLNCQDMYKTQRNTVSKCDTSNAVKHYNQTNSSNWRSEHSDRSVHSHHERKHHSVHACGWVLHPDTQTARQKETLALPRDCESSKLTHLNKQDTPNPTRAQLLILHNFTNWEPSLQRQEPGGVQQIYTITDIQPKKKEL